MLVHRLLQDVLNQQYGRYDKNLQKKSIYCSEQENTAVKAERESIKYMQIKYMKDKIGNTYNGIISGVSDWGIYVEIEENKCEGMVRVKDIKGDYYIFDADSYSLVGEKTKHRYQLGDSVTIKVKNADLIKRHLDFILI